MANKRGVIKNIPPQEIIMEILYRLPAKSVGRFRSVSKEWSSLLSEPSFIETHRNTFNGNHLIIFKSFDLLGPLCFLPFHQNHVEEEVSLSRPQKYASPFDSDVALDVIGCCNGLVLLSAFTYCDLKVSNHRLIVLNPTTKDFLELPVCNCCYDLDSHLIKYFKKYCLYGFSYDSFTDDYKVVTLFYKNKNWSSYDEPAVHVYSLRANTWKHVIDFPYIHPLSNSSNAFSSGNIHRLAAKWDGYSGHLSKIVAFNLADENISEVPSPDDILNSSCELVDVGGKLGRFQELDGQIWLMNEYGVKESWSKISLHGLYRVPRGEPNLFHKQDGQILVVCHDLMLIYNVEEEGLCEYKATSRLWTDLTAKAICAQSLVSPINYGLTNN